MVSKLHNCLASDYSLATLPHQAHVKIYQTMRPQKAGGSSMKSIQYSPASCCAEGPLH